MSKKKISYLRAKYCKITGNYILKLYIKYQISNNICIIRPKKRIRLAIFLRISDRIKKLNGFFVYY